MSTTKDLIDVIRSQERQVAKLERKLGRKAWHLNVARRERDAAKDAEPSALAHYEETARKEGLQIWFDRMREQRDDLARELTAIRELVGREPAHDDLLDVVRAIIRRRDALAGKLDASEREVRALLSIKRDAADVLGCGPEELLPRAARRVRDERDNLQGRLEASRQSADELRAALQEKEELLATAQAGAATLDPAESVATGEAPGAEVARPRFYVAAMWAKSEDVEWPVQDGYALFDRTSGEKVNQWLLSKHPGMTLEDAKRYAEHTAMTANAKGSYR